MKVYLAIIALIVGSGNFVEPVYAEPQIPLCSDPGILNSITESTLSTARTVFIPVIRMLAGGDAPKLIAAMSQVRHSIVEIAQSSYDSENEIRFCEGNYRVKGPDNPRDQEGLANTLSFADPFVDKNELRKLCGPGPIHYKIQRRLDGPGGWVTSWTCTN